MVYKLKNYPEKIHVRGERSVGSSTVVVPLLEHVRVQSYVVQNPLTVVLYDQPFRPFLPRGYRVLHEHVPLIPKPLLERQLTAQIAFEFLHPFLSKYSDDIVQ